MKILTSNSNSQRTLLSPFWKKILGLLPLLGTILYPTQVKAQLIERAFTPRFEAVERGDQILIGNTILECDPTPGLRNADFCEAARTGSVGPTDPQDNNDFFMRYVDIDGNPATFNSSRANLELPAGVTGADVLWAGLYWGADLQHEMSAADNENLTLSPGCQNAGITEINSVAHYENCQANRVLLETPTSGGYVSVIADQFDSANFGPGGRGRRYQGIADVTNLVRAGGAGDYTVANIQASSGVSQSGPYGGWGLVTVYRDPNSPFGRIIVYDGFAFVNNANRCLDINNITGFRTPETGNFAARLGMIAYEGDRAQRFERDTFEVNDIALSDASNPVNNFFNSSISGPSTNLRTPDYDNNFGFDSNNLVINDAQAVFQNNATSADVRFCTGPDGYSPGLLTFSTQTQVADLRLSKTVDNPTPDLGSNITFTLTLTNDGPDTATGVAVLDQLPAGLTFVSDNPSQGTYDNITGLWTVGSVPNQEVATLNIVATVTTTNPVVNTAQVSASDQPDPDSTPGNNNPDEDDQASVTVTGQESDLVLSKSVDNLNPTVGDIIAYTITLTNNGPSNATGVEITDQLPSGLTYISDDSGNTYNPTTGVWTVGNLATGATITLTVNARVDTANEVINTASITASDQPDPNPDNNEGTVTIPPQEADLEVRKIVDESTPRVGETITYTISVTNNGPSNATNVSITDQLPTGLTFVSANPNLGDYDNSTGIWTIGRLDNGEIATLQISAIVSLNETITNVARVSSSDQFDPSPANNEDNEVIGPIGVPNLELLKRITRVNGTVVGQSENLPDWPTNFVRGLPSSNTIQPDDEVEYTIYFRSAGSGPLENAIVCDPLQDFQTFLPNTFNGQTPIEGTFGAEVGIALALNPPNPDLPTAYLRSANSASNRGRFYPSGTTTPLICEQNVRGAVVVEIGDLGVGEYGFIRFRVTID